MGNPITSAAARQTTVTTDDLNRLDELALTASVHMIRLKQAVDEIAARLTVPDAPHLPTGVICLDAARARRATRNTVRRTLGGGGVMADCTCIWKNGVRIHACTLHADTLPSGLHIEAAWSTRHDEPKGGRR